MADAQLQVVINAKDEATAKLNKIAGTMAKFGAAAGLAAVAAAGVFIKKSIDAAKAEEVAMAKVDAITKTLKGNLDEHTKSITDASKAAMRLGFDDEDAAIAMAKLLQVTGDTETAQDGMRVAMDLARLKGIDLSDAQNAVTLAMGGNVRMLKQLGIDVPENASKQDVLRLAMEKVGGQADAYAGTLEGANQRAKVAFENVQEEVGKIFLPIMANMFTSISNFLTSDRLQGWLANIKTLFNDHVFPAMKKVGDFMVNVLWPAIVDNIVPAWKTAFDAIQPHLPLLQNIAKWIGIIAGGALLGAFILVSDTIAFTVWLMAQLIDKIISVIDWFKKLFDAVKNIKENLKFGVENFTSQLPNWMVPGRAGGGYVSGSTPYMVGERGPELFVPGSSGNIVPNNKMGGGGVTLNISGNTFGNRNDIDYMISEVKRVLNREQVLNQLGV